MALQGSGGLWFDTRSQGVQRVSSGRGPRAFMSAAQLRRVGKGNGAAFPTKTEGSSRRGGNKQGEHTTPEEGEPIRGDWHFDQRAAFVSPSPTASLLIGVHKKILCSALVDVDKFQRSVIALFRTLVQMTPEPPPPGAAPWGPVCFPARGTGGGTLMRCSGHREMRHNLPVQGLGGLSYLGPQTGWHTASVLNNSTSGPDGLDLMQKVPDTVAEGAWWQRDGWEEVGRERCSCQSPAGSLLSHAVPPEPRHPNVTPPNSDPPIWMDGCTKRALVTLGK
ncbi:unnamed protein product [Tetraodon nigroviridis]|uniref:(spotted green pufferfish) hypothetical protein n=1 Tax=Tetraodon nigroviridis TaxID=99883 RepID=Q4RLV3_TETNG|nr:unnamed protein product [Tetraodon nigroviridis]